MTSDSHEKKLVIDTSMAPDITPSVSPPRRVMMGTDVHKVRPESTLLPASPWSFHNPSDEIWLTGVDGQPILYVEDPEPVYIRGAPGYPRAAKSDDMGDWRNQHAALRAKNLIRRSSRGGLATSYPPSGFIEVAPEAFIPKRWDPAQLSTAALYKSGYVGYGGSERPRAMMNDDFDIGPSPLRNPVEAIEASIRERHRLSNGSIVTRASVGCLGCENCIFGGAKDPTENWAPDTSYHQYNCFRFLNDQFPEGYPNGPEEYPTGPRWKQGPPICVCTNGPTKPEDEIYKPRKAFNKPNPPPPPPEKEKESRIRLLGKSILTSRADKKQPKTINLEERNGTDAPRNRHYEGCILCSPQPSPNSSVAGSWEERGKFMYAPSGQNPGPPPLTPPPSPGGQASGSGISTSGVPIFPASFDPIKRLLTQEVSKEHCFTPGPRIPVKQEGFGSSAFYKRSNSCRLQPNYEDTHLSPSPNGSVENLTRASGIKGFIRGKRSYLDKKDQKINTRPESGEGSRVRRSPLFTTFPPTTSAHDRGIKRLPSSNCPTFYGTPHAAHIRLPDDLNDGPHPGVRLDHQFLGADGVYEMVDFNNEYPENKGIKHYVRSQNVVTKWQLFKEKARKFMDVMRMRFGHHPAVIFVKNWTTMIALITGLTLAAVIAVILIFILPAAIQSKVKDATVRVNLLRMTNITNNSTSIELDLVINSGANVHASFSPSVFNLTSNNKKNRVFLTGDSEDADTGVENYAPLGYVSSNGTVLPNGNGNLTLKGSIGAGELAPSLNVRTNLANMAEGLIWGEYKKEIGMNMAVQGYVHLSTHDYNTGVTVYKELIIPSMGGFQDLRIDSYELLRPQDGFIDAYLTWFNPANIQMNLGDVEFNLLFGDFIIGNATITSLEIVPGDNKALLSSRLFENSPIKSNQTLFGEFMSSFYIQGPRPGDTKMLRLQGYNTTLDGIEISWLLPAIRAFTKNLPLSNKERAHADISTNIRLATKNNRISSLEMTNIESKVKLPFESENFPVSVEGASYALKVYLPSLRNRELYHFNSTINAGNTTVLSGVHTTISTLVGQVHTCEWTFRKLFMPAFITSKTIPMRITGSMIANVSTSLGDGYVSGINISNRTWEFNGLDGLDGGGNEKVVIANEIVAGRYWNVSLQIHNPSDMSPNFGRARFDVSKGNTAECFGDILVDELALDYGYTNIEAKLDLDASRCNSSNKANFLSNYLAGGRNDLVLKVTSRHRGVGLTGLEIGATWVSPGYKLIEFINIFIRGDSVTAEIMLVNPFPTVLALGSVDMGLVLTGGSTTIATINHSKTRQKTIVMGNSRILSKVALTPTVSLNQLGEMLEGEVLGGIRSMSVTVGGSIGLVLGDYGAPVIRYTQEDIPVGLRWEN